MLTISKPLSSGQARTYHTKEFTSKEQNYWSQRGVVQGEWQGQLAGRFGLTGAVSAADFARLSQGQHPHSGRAGPEGIHAELVMKRIRKVARSSRTRRGLHKSSRCAAGIIILPSKRFCG